MFLILKIHKDARNLWKLCLKKMMVPQFLSATWIIFGPRLPSANCQLFSHLQNVQLGAFTSPTNVVFIYAKKHHRNVSRFHNWWCSLNRLYTSLASWPLEVSYKEMLQKWCLLVQSPIFDTECFGWWLDDLWVTQRSTSFMIWNQEICDFFSKFTSWIDLWRGFLCAMSARLALHRVGDQPMIAANHRLCCCISAQHEFILTVDPVGSKTKLVMV